MSGVVLGQIGMVHEGVTEKEYEENDGRTRSGGQVAAWEVGEGWFAVWPIPALVSLKA